MYEVFDTGEPVSTPFISRSPISPADAKESGYTKRNAECESNTIHTQTSFPIYSRHGKKEQTSIPIIPKRVFPFMLACMDAILPGTFPPYCRFQTVIRSSEECTSSGISWGVTVSDDDVHKIVSLTRKVIKKNVPSIFHGRREAQHQNVF